MSVENAFWWLATVLISTVLGIVGWFAAGWIRDKDLAINSIKDHLATHDKEIAVIKSDFSHITNKLQEMMDELHLHIENEENYWRDNTKSLEVIKSGLLVINARHEIEDKK